MPCFAYLLEKAAPLPACSAFGSSGTNMIVVGA